MLTIPRRGHAARMYSESGDHAHWVILASAAKSLAEGLPVRTDEVVEGVRSAWNEADMVNVEDLRTTMRLFIAARMKCPPRERATCAFV